MKKITVFIEGSQKTVEFDEIIEIRHDNPYIFVKSASIFWNYKNIFTGYNDRITKVSSNITLIRGYWTFDLLATRLKKENILLTKSEVDSKCEIETDETLNLGNFGELLGFDANTTILKNIPTISPNKVEINRGLRYIEISCDVVNQSGNFKPNGKRSSVISTLPITSDSSLSGSITHYKDIESKVSINKGAYNNITFYVNGNNSITYIGSVLLDVYIM